MNMHRLSGTGKAVLCLAFSSSPGMFIWGSHGIYTLRILNVIGVLNVPVHCLPNVPPNVTPI